jgi:hypothetical protein
MKQFVGAMQWIGFGAGLAVLGAGLAMVPPGTAAQATLVTQVMAQDPSPLLGHSGASSQGYLGVELADVDQEKAQGLKLSDVRGAVITLIDHDAPAGQANLRVNDVVVQFNGQPVEGAEQLRRMLREIPAGRKVQLAISRDGNVQTITVQLADRRVIEQNAWNTIGKGGDVIPPPGGTDLFPGGADVPLPGMFRVPLFTRTLDVGAIVEPLTSQTADYLGVASGLMVKRVMRKTEAEKAGLKARDVILKVGAEPIANSAGWDRALRTNQGKPVQVTILRDGKQQTLTLQVDSKRNGELLWQELFPNGGGSLLAETGPDALSLFGANDGAAAQALRDQAQALKNQLKDLADGQLKLQMDPQAAELRKQAEQLRDQLRENGFKFDSQQMEQFKRQMEEFRKNFKPEDFKLDEKKLQEWIRQMEQFRKQMDEWRLTCSDRV